MSHSAEKRQQKLLVHLNTSAAEQEQVLSEGETRFYILTLRQGESMMFPESQQQTPVVVFKLKLAIWEIHHVH